MDKYSKYAKVSTADLCVIFETIKGMIAPFERGQGNEPMETSKGREYEVLKNEYLLINEILLNRFKE